MIVSPFGPPTITTVPVAPDALIVSEPKPVIANALPVGGFAKVGALGELYSPPVADSAPYSTSGSLLACTVIVFEPPPPSTTSIVGRLSSALTVAAVVSMVKLSFPPRKTFTASRFSQLIPPS